MKIQFSNREIRIENYPFEASSIYPNGVISSDQIIECNLKYFPPQLVIKDKEIIFIEATYKKDLEEFARQQAIPCVDRPDIWSGLLEPFLDTTLNEAQSSQIYRFLAQNGLSKTETEAIRKKVEQPMTRFTLMTWEWQHYGQYDLLSAFTLQTPTARQEFYAWTMEIALRNQ